MQRLRTLVMVAVVFLGLTTVAAYAETFSVTDTHGQVVELKSLKIDYTSYSFTYTSDWSYNDIRVMQGSGTVKVQWSKIREVRLLDPGKSLKAEIALRTGDPMTVDLVGDSKGGLVGESALGEFTIRLRDVKQIVVTPNPPKRPGK